MPRSEEENLMKYETIPLYAEDGTEVSAKVLSMVERDGEEYYLVTPDDSLDEVDLYILKVVEDEDGSKCFAEVEDEDEYDEVAAAFEEAIEVLNEEGLIEEN